MTSPVPPPGIVAPLSTFIGRTRETAELLDLVERRRLVTLVGPGGTGKTRLALELAQALGDRLGASRAALDVADASNRAVDSAAATSFGLQDDPDVDAVSLLRDRFTVRPAVLVLDNIEGLPRRGRSLVARIAQEVPGLRVIATGRTPLHVDGEQEYGVGPLAVPETTAAPAAVVTYDAVRLFVDRARLVDPGFGISERNADRVAAICRRLDGLPLAIELAAARLKVVSLDELEASLVDALSLAAADDRPQRHRTLRQTIAWSVRQLDPAGAAFLGHLSIFPGSFDLAAARAVAPDAMRHNADALLYGLVDRSLVTTLPGDGPRRFRLLDTIRQFATEQLDRDDQSASRHAQHFATLAPPGEWSPEDLQTADRANFHQALEWAVEHDGLLLARLATGVAGFWRDHGDVIQAERWLRLGLEGRDDLPADLVALALEQLASLQMALGDRQRAEILAIDALRLNQQLDNARGIVRAHAFLGELRALGRGPSATAEAIRELEAALAIARRLEDHHLTIHVLGALGSAQRLNDAASMRYYSEARDLARQVNDARAEALALSNLGYLNHRMGRSGDAVAMASQAAGLFQFLGDQRNEAWALLNLASMLVGLEQYAEAVDVVRRADRLADAVGATPELVQVLEVGAELLVAQGDGYAAAVVRAAVDAVRAVRRLDRPIDEQAPWDRATERFRQSLGAEAHRRARAEGAALNLPAALGLVRARLDAPADAAPAASAPADRDGHVALTARELAVLRLVGLGQTDTEIAASLGISPKTVSVHVTNIKRKLGLETRLQLVVRARPEVR